MSEPIEGYPWIDLTEVTAELTSANAIELYALSEYVGVAPEEILGAILHCEFEPCLHACPMDARPKMVFQYSRYKNHIFFGREV